MKLLNYIKIFLAIIIPILIYLSVSYIVFNDENYFDEKLFEYKSEQKVPNAKIIHEKVFSFLKNEDASLPGEFNEKEKQHLADVRSMINAAKLVLLVSLALFLSMMVASGFFLRAKGIILNFFGKIIVYGAILAILISIALFFMINSSFGAAFEKFHQVFFTAGTYSFDPQNDIITKIYPEQLFMDAGLRVSKLVLAVSAVLIIIGALLLFRNKR